MTNTTSGPRTLADALTAAGAYTTAWAAELDAVPREYFIPPHV